MDTTTIHGYILENPDKIRRALEGSPTSKGKVGGVAAEDGTYDDDALLVEYDKLGGFISDKGIKVKTGSFYDTKTRMARKEYDVVYLKRINGEMLEFRKGDKGMDAVVDALGMVNTKVDEAKKKRLAKRKNLIKK